MNHEINNVIEFSKYSHDRYVQYKTNVQEMTKFDLLLRDITSQILEKYPDTCNLDGYYTLFAESLLSMIMYAEGIDHPLQKLAQTVGVEFLAEYE